MQPSFDLRIRSMIRSLSQSVLPALDPSNRAALEQTRLVIASLELLRKQIDFAHWFEVADVLSMAGLVEKLLQSAPGTAFGPRAANLMREAIGTVNRHDVPLSELSACNRDLRGIVKSVLEEAFASGDELLRRRVQSLVLEAGKAQVARERAFVAAAGFDVFPETLTSIEQALSRAE